MCYALKEKERTRLEGVGCSLETQGRYLMHSRETSEGAGSVNMRSSLMIFSVICTKERLMRAWGAGSMNTRSSLLLVGVLCT